MVKLVGISFGHNDPFNVGADGFLSEDNINEKVGQAVIDKINLEGKCRAVRLYKDNVVSYEDSINYRPNMANALGCDIAIDIHHNSFVCEAANGCEALGTGTESEKLGDCILAHVGKIYYNRGFKYNNYAFNTITVMPSIIYEGFFVSNKADCNKYNKYNEAAAIIKGIYDYFDMVGVEEDNSPEPNSSNSNYVIKEGDTLWGISVKLGVSVDHLVNQNNITNPSLIYPGQTLIYGNGSNAGNDNNDVLGNQYVVEDGDCLSVIAENLGVDMSKLISLNGIEDASLIYPGQILKY